MAEEDVLNLESYLREPLVIDVPARSGSEEVNDKTEEKEFIWSQVFVAENTQTEIAEGGITKSVTARRRIADCKLVLNFVHDQMKAFGFQVGTEEEFLVPDLEYYLQKGGPAPVLRICLTIIILILYQSKGKDNKQYRKTILLYKNKWLTLYLKLLLKPNRVYDQLVRDTAKEFIQVTRHGILHLLNEVKHLIKASKCKPGKVQLFEFADEMLSEYISPKFLADSKTQAALIDYFLIHYADQLEGIRKVARAGMTNILLTINRESYESSLKRVKKGLGPRLVKEYEKLKSFTKEERKKLKEEAKKKAIEEAKKKEEEGRKKQEEEERKKLEEEEKKKREEEEKKKREEEEKKKREEEEKKKRDEEEKKKRKEDEKKKHEEEEKKKREEEEKKKQEEEEKKKHEEERRKRREEEEWKRREEEEWKRREEEEWKRREDERVRSARASALRIEQETRSVNVECRSPFGRGEIMSNRAIEEKSWATRSPRTEQSEIRSQTSQNHMVSRSNEQEARHSGLDLQQLAKGPFTLEQLVGQEFKVEVTVKIRPVKK